MIEGAPAHSPIEVSKADHLNRPVSIDPEFAHWIAPLSDEERRLLEESLLEEGCRDPITTWNGVIVDGHHRYWICTANGIPFETRERAFESREAVKEWMLRAQLARRNLTKERWTHSIGTLYQMQKKDTPNPGGVNQYADEVRDNKCPQPKTAERLAEQFGVHPNTVKNAAKFAEAVDARPEEEREIILAGKSGLSQKEVVKGLGVHFSSESEEWYTPPEIVDAVISVLGAVDVDPCSNSHDAPNIPAAVVYTQDDDGLAQEWHGRLYMNPPYGREVVLWAMKALDEIEAGRVTEAIILVAARPDTQWFKSLGEVCHAWCAVEGRLHFSGHKDGAPFPSAVFYYGENLRDFYLAFSGEGMIWRRLDWGEADIS